MKIFDFDKLLDSLSGYLETKIELIKLDIESEVHKIVAKAIIILLVASTISLAVILLSVGLSMLLNTTLKSDYLGFILVSGLYVLVGLVIYFRREQIFQSVIDSISDQEEENNEE